MNRSQSFLLLPSLPDHHVYINYVACEAYTMKKRDGRDSLFFADKKQFGMKRNKGRGGRRRVLESLRQIKMETPSPPPTSRLDTPVSKLPAGVWGARRTGEAKRIRVGG